MKGTAPRDVDPVRDAELAEALRGSEKDQAENLMIVDLLRNDLSRICRVGSVKVPELFAVESYATLHQMVSRVVGQLTAPASIAGLMAALFPCGSITGAPKIRAMQIIRQVEPHARGAYCGAIGWMAPDGAAAFSVAIRTVAVFEGGRVRLNVGGGVVQDSTAQGEWDEAMWKTRFVSGLGFSLKRRVEVRSHGLIRRRGEERQPAAYSGNVVRGVQRFRRGCRLLKQAERASRRRCFT